MTWWLIPSILGVTLFGIIVGLLVSRQIVKLQYKGFPFFHRRNGHNTDPTPGESVYQPTGGPIGFATKNQQTQIKTVANTDTDERLQVYLKTPKSQSAVKIPLNPALLELNKNLSIASRPSINSLVSYQTDVWSNKRNEFNGISRENMDVLIEAYVDMMLANNVVWLVNELGRDSQDLKDSYARLSSKVAERLTRIMPDIRNSFK